MIETDSSENRKNHWKAIDKLASFLAKRDYSEREIREKLFTRFESDIIDHAIEYAKERGWILPPEQLSLKVTEELLRKRKGSLYIRQYLSKKGLPPVEISWEQQVENGKHLVERKYGDITSLSYDDKIKAHRLLKNRGYEDGLIRTVIYEN